MQKDYADKSYLKNDRIKIGYMDMSRIKARELLKIIQIPDWQYVRPEDTDIRKTFARNVGLP